MIAGLAGSLLGSYAAHRRRVLERVWREAMGVQERTLGRLVATARGTEFELDRPYAVALTTPAGLWSYLLGDTVRFVARDPLRLLITGRVRHFVNAFGENVIVEEVERALVEACRRTEAEVVEFTVAPRYPSPTEPRGGHDWLVEFHRLPRTPAELARVVDETLIALNADYRTKRAGDVGMRAPRLFPLPAGSFYRWMREARQARGPAQGAPRDERPGRRRRSCTRPTHPLVRWARG